MHENRKKLLNAKYMNLLTDYAFKSVFGSERNKQEGADSISQRRP